MQINIIKVRTVGVFPFREIHLAKRDETWGGTKKEKKSSNHGNKKPFACKREPKALTVLGVGRKNEQIIDLKASVSWWCPWRKSESEQKAASNLVQRRDEQKYNGRKKQSSCWSSFQNREHIWSLAELFLSSHRYIHHLTTARGTQRPAACTCKVPNTSGLKWSEKFNQRVLSLSQICFWKILRGWKRS